MLAIFGRRRFGEALFGVLALAGRPSVAALG